MQPSIIATSAQNGVCVCLYMPPTHIAFRFEDMAGDGLEWEFHCQGHYDDLFAEFAQRMDMHVDSIASQT